MQVGDRVRLKRTSRLRELFGRAADATGIVSHVSGASLAWQITVGYPHLSIYASPLPAGEFDVILQEERTADDDVQSLFDHQGPAGDP